MENEKKNEKVLSDTGKRYLENTIFFINDLEKKVKEELEVKK